MQNWRLTIEYDGTRYSGWQRQPNARTVQGELFKAAQQVFSEPLDLGGAGRTDAGVHALRQVAHLKGNLVKPMHPKQLQMNLNDHLPADINILDLQKTSMQFNARRDALLRSYLYQIATRRTAFGKPYVWWVKDRLKLDAMYHASQYLIGLHDFGSFCEIDKVEKSTLVKVETVEVVEVDELILFRIGASHFLWKMVRRIVGSLVEVGRGNLTVNEFAKLLKVRSNAPAAWTAPPSGLFLEQVLYPGNEYLTPIKPAFPIDFGREINAF